MAPNLPLRRCVLLLSSAGLAPSLSDGGLDTISLVLYLQAKPASKAATKPASKAAAKPASKASVKPASKASVKPASRAGSKKPVSKVGELLLILYLMTKNMPFGLLGLLG